MLDSRLTVVLDEVGERSPTRVGRYAAEVARSLAATAPEGFRVEALAPKVSEARQERMREAVPGLAALRHTAVPPRELRQAWLHSMTTIPVRGLVHATSLLAPLVREPATGDQVTVTVHGLQPLSDRSERKRRWFDRALKRALHRADGIVVPTTAIAEELAERGGAPERIRVIAPAPTVWRSAPSDASTADDIARRLALPAEYVLARTSPGSRGDAERLVQAIAAPTMPDVRVVVAGPVEWADATLAAMAVEAGIPAGRLVMVGDVDETDLAVAHDRALALLHAAEHDALGLDVLDAASFGTPAVHTMSRSIAELTDGASVAIAGDPAELANGLAVLLDDEERRARIGLQAMDRARAFTWDAAASEVWRLHAEL